MAIGVNDMAEAGRKFEVVARPDKIDRENAREKLPAYMPHIIQTLRRRNCRDPEDASQEVLLRVWEDVAVNGVVIDYPPTYLANACRNYLSGHYRKLDNQVTRLPEDFDIPTDIPKYHILLDIEAAMERLTQRDRQTLMAELEPQGGEAPGVNRGTKAQWLKRARDRLGDVLGYQRKKKSHEVNKD